MQNKTDQFMGFDPTQNQGSGCCGSVYWDFETQTWKQRPLVVQSNSDCSQVQNQLNQANAIIADLMAQRDAAIERANELQAELDAQPTVCEILAQHLDPIRRLNDEIVWYGLKNADGCPDLATSAAQSLGNQDVTTVVNPPTYSSETPVVGTPVGP